MLHKDSLRLIHLENTEEKMAWLAEELSHRIDRIMVVCFDKEESEMLQRFFQYLGIGCGLLNTGILCNLSNKQKMEMQYTKASFLEGKIRVLITVFGYSVDLSGLQGNIDELIFYQKPLLWGNLEKVYQKCFKEQNKKCSILLPEEKEKQEKYYMEKCANQETVEAIFTYFYNVGLPVTEKELQGYINKSTGEIKYSLEAMEKSYCIFRNGAKYCYADGDDTLVAGKIWESQQVIWQQEEDMRQFCEHVGYEQFSGDKEFQATVSKAHQFFCDTEYEIATRKLWPCGFQVHGVNKIEYPYQKGIAIAQNQNLGYGTMIAKELETNSFSKEFLEILTGKVESYVRSNNIRWITYMEEENRDGIMVQLAEKLGKRLGIFVASPITVIGDDRKGHNPVQECHYISQKYQINVEHCYRDNYLILKRNAGSRYALAYCCNMLGMVGCGKAFPCTLFLNEK